MPVPVGVPYGSPFFGARAGNLQTQPPFSALSPTDAHELAGYIGCPLVHPKALPNSSKFCTLPFVRQRPGECGSVSAIAARFLRLVLAPNLSKARKYRCASYTRRSCRRSSCPGPQACPATPSTQCADALSAVFSPASACRSVSARQVIMCRSSIEAPYSATSQSFSR